jgi:pyruvate dehydrogenase E2 component (dihydrolipoamide acetyltransferase)
VSEPQPNPPGLDLAPWPQIDFAEYGPVESQPMSRIQSVVAKTLSRNWVMIPHVTHHEEADISGLDAIRRRDGEANGIKLTPLAYFVKAAVAALQQFPRFNASIDGSGKNLILKQYCHIGIAVDTPHGLLVPVIRNADRKSVPEIAVEISELSQAARGKGLPMDKMSGGCFTISSLGSVGGTSFTPIINAPEVAVMGITRSFEKPVNVEGQLAWRTTLPLSLSYDHRVLNGADAARFCIAFAQSLAEQAAG